MVNLIVSYDGCVSISFYNADTETKFQKIVNMLIAANYNLNKLDKLGYAAIHYASSNGFVDAIKSLLDNEANVNLCDIQGNTAINIAAGKKTLIYGNA